MLSYTFRPIDGNAWISVNQSGTELILYIDSFMFWKTCKTIWQLDYTLSLPDYRPGGFITKCRQELNESLDLLVRYGGQAEVRLYDKFILEILIRYGLSLISDYSDQEVNDEYNAHRNAELIDVCQLIATIGQDDDNLEVCRETTGYVFSALCDHSDVMRKKYMNRVKSYEDEKLDGLIKIGMNLADSVLDAIEFFTRYQETIKNKSLKP